MKRILLSIRLVLEALIGIVLLYNCGGAIVISLFRNLNIANIVGIILGIGITADAFRVRRMLNQLDAKNDPPQN
jgi:hypothetical protein